MFLTTDFKISLIENFLSPHECQQFIESIKNPVKKVVKFTDYASFSNNKYVDQPLNEFFYQRLTEKAPQVIEKCLILRPNNLIMTGHYQPGEKFNLHTDTGLYFDQKLKEKTNYTCLIYLNDDFEGGHTVFFDEHHHMKIMAEVIPRAGMALIFDISLWHQGNPVIKGEKFWIGNELIGKF